MKSNIRYIKKLFIAASSMLMSTSVLAAETASTATIDFSGRVTSNSCSLATESAVMNVPLGEVSLTALETQGTGSRVPFGIRLVGCNPAVNSIALTFQDALGSPSSRGSNILLSSPTGDEPTADNMGVQITRASSTTPITLGNTILITPNKVGESALPEQTLNFNAFMAKTSVNATPTPGVVKARATVTIRASTTVMPGGSVESI